MLTHFPQAVPEIPVSNGDKAAEYYVRVLGFSCDWRNDDESVEAVEDKPWNLREFRLADLDGNQLRAFYDFNREMSEERRLERHRRAGRGATE